MDQSDIDLRAVALFEANRVDILRLLLRHIYVVNLLQKLLPGADLVVFGLVLVSGDSLKAAKFRELTGRPLPREAIENVPLICRNFDDYLSEWKNWVGDDEPERADPGCLLLIIFTGSGHSVLSINPLENRELAQKLLRQIAVDLRPKLEQLRDDPQTFLTEGWGRLERKNQIREPRIQDS